MIELASGDILSLRVDAVVCSAHPTLRAGSGMSGHFHRYAGPELETAARKLGPLEPGNSVVTAGFDLRIPLVVHAVAPRYIMKSEDEEQLLRQKNTVNVVPQHLTYILEEIALYRLIQTFLC